MGRLRLVVAKRVYAVPNHLRAPAQHGDMLLSPAGSLAGLARANEAALSLEMLWGQPLQAIRKAARAEIVRLSTRWTNDLVGPVREPSQPQYWVIGGHQPELFHPGVWVKNAVVAGLSSQLGGVGLNLTVDNDLCSGSSVRVPRHVDSAGIMTLDWDRPRPQSPWEERPLPDPATFASFGARCRENLRPWQINPLAASQEWGTSPERSIVDQLAQLRVRFERSAGVENLELKVSDLADSDCFRRFLFGALREADTLRNAYNTALIDYRTLNRIRSRSHPVPPLDAAGDSIEVPFWVWRTGESRRSRLFVQRTDTGVLRLSDGLREMGTISGTSEAEALIELGHLSSCGWKIRPRALTLTLFCRICLGSVFVHGIGGAKYDEMTDALMQCWLGLRPPQIVVATATQRLFEQFAGPQPERQIEQLQHELRRIQWNPEEVSGAIAEDAEAMALRNEKRALWKSPMDRGLRHARIQRINAALREGLNDHETSIRDELQKLLASIPYQAFLRSREFAAVLFPADSIHELFRNAIDRVQQS